MQSELPQPTDEQYEEFAQYVCWSHSWYKHISLLEGAEFVFFFSKEAGKGYSKEHSRLHYGWKTTEEYQHRFGHLDYMYRFAGSQAFSRDSHAYPFLPSEELLFSCCTILYPYVSSDFNAPSVLAEIIAEECLDKLRATSNHPHQKEILQWFEAYQLQEQKWQELSAAEQDIASSWDNQQQTEIKAGLTELPIQVANYVQLEMNAMNLYTVLQEGGLEKIKSTLAQLHELSKTEVQVWW